MKSRVATAFAPASVANLAVGFDVLGFAISGIGDRVRVRSVDRAGIEVAHVGGVASDLPREPDRNTASVAIEAMGHQHPLPEGIAIDLYKGIPLGSGMGGSAASAVAAVVAANALLDVPLPLEELLPFAVAGEGVASGAAHADNVAPSLFGGMVAVVSPHPIEVVSIPVPAGLLCVLVHPELEIETRRAREAMSPTVPLATHVEQSQRLAGFLAGCFRNDLSMVGRSMVDLIAEPARGGLIPGYADAKQAAFDAGAIGFAISGAGPTVFALVDNTGGSTGVAEAVSASIVDVLAAHGLSAESWIGPIASRGAHLVSPDSSFMNDGG